MTHATADRETRSPDPSKTHPAAQALLAGLMQGLGEKYQDEALLAAGRRLGEAAKQGAGDRPNRPRQAGAGGQGAPLIPGRAPTCHPLTDIAH